MNIIFDLDQLNPGWDDNIPFDQKIAIDDIYEFVESRVKVLKESIENEEQDRNNVAIIIAFTQNKIMFMGYSDSLTNKLTSCFNENDTDFIQRKIFESSKNFLN